MTESAISIARRKHHRCRDGTAALWSAPLVPPGRLLPFVGPAALTALLGLLCLGDGLWAGAEIPPFRRLHIAAPLPTQPAIDGVCDGLWADVPADEALFDFHAATPRKAPCGLSLRLGTTAQGLALFLRNPEGAMERLRTAATARDAPDLWKDDCVEIYLVPGPEPDRYFKLTVNVAGVTGDATWHKGGGTDAAWTATGLAVATAREEEAWTAELFLPWKAFGRPPGPGAVWRFAIVRLSYTEGERFGTTAPGARFNQPDAFGWLVFPEAKAPPLPTAAEALQRAGMDAGVITWQGRGVRLGADAARPVPLSGLLAARCDDLAGRTRALHHRVPDAERRRLLAAQLARFDTFETKAAATVALAHSLHTLRQEERRVEALSYNDPVEGPVTDKATGADVYTLHSPYLAAAEQVKVLVPDGYDKQRSCRVLYILPVEAGFKSHFGYGLKTLKDLDAHNRHDLILVQMGFPTAPWFGDHATDPQIRHSTYLRETVVPFIEKTYSTLGTREGRLLFGFSKSGWGAFSLLLRNPEFYGYAAAWDAPLMFTTFHFGMEALFGTPAQLDAYRPDLLANQADGEFKERTRLVLGGEKLWGTMRQPPGGRSHTVVFHELLTQNGVKHVYRPDLAAPHTWNAAWAGPLLEDLMALMEPK